MGYTRDYLIFMIREAVEMMEMDERCNEVGRDEWVWLQQAQDIVAEADSEPEDSPTALSNAGLCAEIPSGMAPMECVLSDVFVPNIGGCYGMDVEALAGISMSHHWFPPSPPPPGPFAVTAPTETVEGMLWPVGGDTMVTSGGQATPNAPNTITSGSGIWKHIPIEIIVVDNPAKELHESIDDILFAPVTTTAPKLG